MLCNLRGFYCIRVCEGGKGYKVLEEKEKSPGFWEILVIKIKDAMTLIKRLIN
jgi:hypothetical protein